MHFRVEESQSSCAEGHVKFHSSRMEVRLFDVRFSMEDVPVVHHKFLTAGVLLQFKLGTSVPRRTGGVVKVVLLPEGEGTIKSSSDHRRYGLVSCDGVGGDGWFEAVPWKSRVSPLASLGSVRSLPA